MANHADPQLLAAPVYTAAVAYRGAPPARRGSPPATQLAGPRDRLRGPVAPAGSRRPPVRLLADHRFRMAAGSAVVFVTAIAAQPSRVSPGEAQAFRAINDLPGSLYPAAWLIMQVGALGAAPMAAVTAWLAGERVLARRLLVSGTGTWALSKLVKRMVRRPRPAVMLAGTRCRGRAATGLGYPSGHVGVAVALGAAALPAPGPSAVPSSWSSRRS
jgi:hypothetical protein